MPRRLSARPTSSLARRAAFATGAFAAASFSISRVGIVVSRATVTPPASQPSAVGEYERRPDFLPEERRRWPNGRPPGYRQDRAHGTQHRLLQEADADGWELREIHPGRIHLEECNVRLGGVDWAEVRRFAVEAEDGIAELPVPEVRQEVRLHEGETTLSRRAGERCVVSTKKDLAVAFAARCIDRPLVVRYRISEPAASWLTKQEVARALDSMYFDGTRQADDETGGLYEIREVQGRSESARTNLLALLDVDCVCPTRKTDATRRPHYPKAWAYARRMLEGEWFPAVHLRWHKKRGWQFGDGCNRCWASRIAGIPLNVSLCAATLARVHAVDA